MWGCRNSPPPHKKKFKSGLGFKRGIQEKFMNNNATSLLRWSRTVQSMVSEWLGTSYNIFGVSHGSYVMAISVYNWIVWCSRSFN